MPSPMAMYCAIVRVKSPNACVGCCGSQSASLPPVPRRSSIAAGSASAGSGFAPASPGVVAHRRRVERMALPEVIRDRLAPGVELHTLANQRHALELLLVIQVVEV